MKRHLLPLAFLLAVSALSLAAGEEADSSPLELSLTVDAAWYPQSDYKSSSGGTHFAPVTGAMEGFEARAVFAADYTLPFLQGSSDLTEDNHVTLSAGLELSPVSVAPQFSVTFSPIAFLELFGGISVGTGWSAAGFRGMAEFKAEKAEYEAMDSFGGCHIFGYGGATLMFDTGAIWEGDWNHVVAMATYQVGYEKLTGTSKDVWCWQETYGKANGLVFDQYYLLGYQMPLTLSLVAVSLELTGHYNGDDYGDYDDSYNGDFMMAEIGPVFQLTLGKKDELTLLAQFASRRSFAESHDDFEKEPLLTQTGREWFFGYIAASWKHVF